MNPIRLSAAANREELSGNLLIDHRPLHAFRAPPHRTVVTQHQRCAIWRAETLASFPGVPHSSGGITCRSARRSRHSRSDPRPGDGGSPGAASSRRRCHRGRTPQAAGSREVRAVALDLFVPATTPFEERDLEAAQRVMESYDAFARVAARVRNQMVNVHCGGRRSSLRRGPSTGGEPGYARRPP